MSGILVLALRILAAVALYSFIAWAFHTLWKDLKPSPVSTARPPTLHITPAEESGEPHAFDLPLITIGRSDRNTYRLQHPSISSWHARLSHHHAKWWLEDLNSTNGTILNGAPVTSPTLIFDGDQVQFGSIAFHIHIDRPSPN